MVSAGARKILLCHVICGSCGVLCFPSWPALLLEMCATKERWEQRSQKLHIVWRFRIWCDGVFLFLFFLCQNFVVAVGAEGWFHLFDLTAAAASKADSSSQHEFQSPDDQKPFLTQHIPANTKVILISDIGKFSLNSSVIKVDFCDFWVQRVRVCRWRWALRAGGGIHRPSGASLSLGGAVWQLWCRAWSADSVEEMASGGTGELRCCFLPACEITKLDLMRGGGVFSGHTLDPFVQTEHHLNPTVYPSVVPDHIYPLDHSAHISSCTLYFTGCHQISVQ